MKFVIKLYLCLLSSHGRNYIFSCFRIRLILKRTEEDFRDICYLLEKETRCEPSHENIPWTDIIISCIDFKMSATIFQDPQLDEVKKISELFIHR